MDKICRKGRFLFAGNRKWRAYGVSYGPFVPNSHGEPFPEKEVAERDMKQMQALGLNAIRTYHVPPQWLLDLAAEHRLRFFITLAWPLRGLFLENKLRLAEIRKSIRHQISSMAQHPAIFACAIDNEMAPDLARWLGPEKVRKFLDSLILEVKTVSPDLLVTYAGYPPSEYLIPELADFVTFNIYLHDRSDFRAYLNRCHLLAGDRPLMIGEFGIDTVSEGEERQQEIIEWHLEEVTQSGASGTLLFTWTDEWFTGGHEIEDWAFGLTTRERQPKLVCDRLATYIPQSTHALVDHFSSTSYPKFSIIVCTYNGSRTLKQTLESLSTLRYPDFEVIIINDGSTDGTADILSSDSNYGVITQENQGLSVARNRGADEATGEILVYTDDDCMPDTDWLFHLADTFQSTEFAAVGGPNLSPPAAQWRQATVAAAPGVPTHVLLTDMEAEHIPGCNFAIRREALESIGGFDPIYRKAGDDVDLCWRLRDAGYQIGFNPSAMVWHHRRSTIADYLKQQHGYGEAEALLRYQHPNYFDAEGSAHWAGIIYNDHRRLNWFDAPRVYHGIFALGYFQSIYRQPERYWVQYFSSLNWLFCTLVVGLVSLWVPALVIVPFLMFLPLLISAGILMSSAKIEKPHDHWYSRMLLYALCLLQPLLRSWARYFTWLHEQRLPRQEEFTAKEQRQLPSGWQKGRVAFWAEEGQSREQYLKCVSGLLASQGWRFFADTGWSQWDFDLFASRWWHTRLRSVAEIYPENKQLIHIEIKLLIHPISWLLISPFIFILVSLGCQFPVLAVWMGVILFLMVGYLWLERYRVRKAVARVLSAAAIKEALHPMKEEI
ncbi:MAG: glycosyltransferase [Verrucomicrobiota bacterium]